MEEGDEGPEDDKIHGRCGKMTGSHCFGYLLTHGVNNLIFGFFFHFIQAEVV